MITALDFALVFSPASNWDALGAALDKMASTRGFTPGVQIHLESDPLATDYTYRRGTDASLTISIIQESSISDLDVAKRFNEQGAGGRNTQSFLSGIPLGDFCYIFTGNLVSIGGEEFALESRVSTKSVKEQPDDRRLQEAMIRVAFAEAVGTSLDAEGKPARAWSRTLLSRPRAGYRPLSTVAPNARLGDWGDRATFALGGKTIELALGSDAATVDGKSVPLGAFVVRHDGAWLVPAAAILRAASAKATSSPTPSTSRSSA